jgi:hypothetical protein
MKNIIKIVNIFILCFLVQACNDFPVDERGLLITDSEECGMTVFDLLGPDNRQTLVSSTINDETNTVIAVAKFGTNLTHVKPRCSLLTDCIVEPMMGTWEDFTKPHTYTVISGNRKIRKTYTITVTVQGE